MIQGDINHIGSAQLPQSFLIRSILQTRFDNFPSVFQAYFLPGSFVCVIPAATACKDKVPDRTEVFER